MLLNKINRTHTLEIHDLILIGGLRELPVATQIFLRQFSKHDNILRRRCTLLIQAAPSQNQKFLSTLYVGNQQQNDSNVQKRFKKTSICNTLMKYTDALYIFVVK